MQNLVFNIQKFCVHDGPGIRTTVFFKGCNMRCIWCHNPESFSFEKQLSYFNEKCTSCGDCASVCEFNVHTFTKTGEHKIDYSNCVQCGKCVDICLNDCLSIAGKELSTEEIMSEIESDRKYYEQSGGGVTFSGGEPTCQGDFLLELLVKCKNVNISTCVETNGIANRDYYKKINPYVDLYLFDFKHSDENEHERCTGASLEKVLENIKFLYEADKPIVLRCPIIPGINDNDKHFLYIKTLKAQHKNIIDTEIMSYHDIGKSKWDKIGKEYTLSEIKTVDNETKQQWVNKLLN